MSGSRPMTMASAASTDACTAFDLETEDHCASQRRNSKAHAISSAFALGMMVATVGLLTVQHCGFGDASFTKFFFTLTVPRLQHVPGATVTPPEFQVSARSHMTVPWALAPLQIDKPLAPTLSATQSAGCRCSSPVLIASSDERCTRRCALLLGGVIGVWSLSADARTPGSSDPLESIMQIKDAASDLRRLSRDWSTYAVIDSEGRAGNIDAARKVLGGVAPRSGDAAVAVAKTTPLYRIDGAFAAIRKAALDADTGWGSKLDVEALVDIGDRIVFELKKADDNFYSVVFAMKGSTQLRKLYDEAKVSVDSSIQDFDKILSLLDAAGAPGL